MTDLTRAREALRSICPTPPTRVMAIVHDGEPLAKERPRFRRGRTYTSRETVSREHALAMLMRAELRGVPFGSNVAFVAIFYRSTKRTIDCDNCIKLAMDAATLAGAWADDRQVTAQAAWVELDADNPRTVIAIGDTTSSLDRTVKVKKKGGR